LTAAEHFATMADIYGLPEDCARRIAQMLGRDLTAAPMRAWRTLAAYLAQAQLVTLRQALERVLSRDPEGPVPFAVPASGVFWCGNWRDSSIIPTWTFRRS
jgi:hypothetical protein